MNLYEIFIVSIVTVVLFSAYVWIIRRLKFSMRSIYYWAIVVFLFKLVNAFFLYDFLFGGEGDTYMYHYEGKFLVSYISTYPVDFFLYDLIFPASGTMSFINWTGLIYFLFGVSSLKLAAVLATFASSVGVFLFLKSFCVLFPEANHKLFARLIFLFPSVAFWTSIHLKDTWLFFFLALSVYGAAMLHMKKIIKGIVYIFVGCLLGAYLKPHIVLFYLAGWVFLMLKFHARTVTLKIFKPILFVGVVFALLFAYQIAEKQFLGDKEFIDRMESGREAFAQGGSALGTLKTPSSWGDAPTILYNMFAILYRPFIFEARSPITLMSGIENFILIIFTYFYFKKFRYFGKSKYYPFPLVYVLTFLYGFSFQVANLGTMARMKVAILPFLFMLICLHVPPKRRIITRG